MYSTKCRTCKSQADRNTTCCPNYGDSNPNGLSRNAMLIMFVVFIFWLTSRVPR